uniref:Zgc:77748 n=1 Tax=Salarias fasciatus TaxID=181472 RepID=A0A672IVA2_SALFA
MATLDLASLAAPVGIVRVLQVIFTCISFSLVASVGHYGGSFWTWCMFCWCFCFCVTFLILLLEFLSVSAKLPISWSDLTAAVAMLATLMVSNLSPSSFYAVEVGLIRAKSGEISGFLSTVPGLLKVLEAFVACIIFICLDYIPFHVYAGLQWCVAVYSICFIFAILVIIFTICRVLSLFPAPFDKVLTVCNVLAVLMYITAMVIWPLYSFRNNPRPSYCSSSFFTLCPWDTLVVVSVMTGINLVAYIVDTVYSFRLVFFISRS